jgi:methionine-rich copper-binding protein CopC
MTIASFARAAASGAVLVATITAANAHGYLVESFPPRGSHLWQSPRHIKLLFSLRTDAGWSTVMLKRNDGAVLAEERQPITSRSFRMEVPKLSPGAYRVQYSMLTPDGDVLRGEVDFVVDEPGG